MVTHNACVREVTFLDGVREFLVVISLIPSFATTRDFTMRLFPLSLLAHACLLEGSFGFVKPSTIKRPSMELAVQTKSPPPQPAVTDAQKYSYGEESRKFRRTVFTHDDWVKFRDQNRFWSNIATTLNSGLFINLQQEIAITTAVAVFVCVWNAIAGGYVDFAGVKHAALSDNPFFQLIGLPLSPFTLSSPSLGLLLVFRTNTSYRRWDEARKNWGMNINHTRNIVRLASAYYDRAATSQEVAKEDLKRLALSTWAFVRAMKRHLSPEWEDEEAFKKEIRERLPADQAEAIIKAAHRPNRALQDISYSIEKLPMHFIRKNEVQTAATIFEDNLGSSERLLNSPVPLVYARHTNRGLFVWLIMLPFALYDVFGSTWNHFGMIPATALISFFLLGIEELGTQLSEPFTILPMQVYCDRIYNWITEIVSWEPNDNEMFDGTRYGEALEQKKSIEEDFDPREVASKKTGLRRIFS